MDNTTNAIDTTDLADLVVVTMSSAIDGRAKAASSCCCFACCCCCSGGTVNQDA